MSLWDAMERADRVETEVVEFADWMQTGIDRGWVSDIVCSTHNGLPLRKDEEDEFDEGYDPCVPGVRVWL
jgi:hypothetical protein